MRDQNTDRRLSRLNAAMDKVRRFQDEYEPGPTWENLLRFAIAEVMDESEKLLPKSTPEVGSLKNQEG